MRPSSRSERHNSQERLNRGLNLFRPAGALDQHSSPNPQLGAVGYEYDVGFANWLIIPLTSRGGYCPAPRSQVHSLRIESPVQSYSDWGRAALPDCSYSFFQVQSQGDQPCYAFLCHARVQITPAIFGTGCCLSSLRIEFAAAGNGTGRKSSRESCDRESQGVSGG